jgi:trigger factor
MFTKEKIKNLHYAVSGVITADDVQRAVDGILTEYGKKAKVPGFRAGHVPLTLLRQKFGASAAGEAVDKSVNADMEKYLADKKIRLAGQPRADIKNVGTDKDIEYTLEFDILPSLPEIDLSKVTITKKSAETPADEVEKALQNVRKSRAQALKQDTGYAAVNGDVAVIDFKGFLGKTAFPGGEAQKHHLIIGSNSFIPGFEEQLIGRKLGEEFDIAVKFPADYHAENLAGKDARFEVKIHELRHHDLPELNDALAKAVGMDSADALRAHIEKILGDQYRDASLRQMRAELLEVLADKVKLDLPETLVAQEYDMAKSEFDRHAGHDHAKDAKWNEKAERADAERRVKLGLILAEWGNANGVTVENADVQKAIWDEASRYPDPSQVFDFYNKNKNALSMLRGMLFEQKALNAMLTRVKTKEKSVKPDELFKQTDVK